MSASALRLQNTSTRLGFVTTVRDTLTALFLFPYRTGTLVILPFVRYIRVIYVKTQDFRRILS